MKLTDRIQNFFYAITHADQLIEENHTLRKQTFNQSLDLIRVEELLDKSQTMIHRLNESKNELIRKQDTLQEQLMAHQTALHTMTVQYPISPEDLYNCVRTHLDHNGEHLYDVARRITKTTDQDIHRTFSHHDPIGLLGRDECDGFTMLRYLEMRSFGNPSEDYSVDEESVEYQNYLSKLYTSVVVKLNFGTYLSAKYAPLLLVNDSNENNPVGRIDYLGSTGDVAESVEYQSESDLKAHAIQDNYCGVPMSITIYSDPVTGKHIDTFWVKELDPPPQGFQIEPCPISQEQVLPVLDADSPDYEP